MKIRLGFWNRLAIALTALALVVIPAWVWIDTVHSAQTAEAQYLESCRANAMTHLLPNGLADWDKIRASDKQCWEDFAKQKGPSPRLWGEAVGLTALLCAIIYSLIWIVVAVIKWVWRGRSTKST